jgi:hypothetical protein
MRAGTRPRTTCPTPRCACPSNATVGYSATQVGALLTEPFFCDSAHIEVHTATKPLGVILLNFSSTKPWEANTTEELVAITPFNWDQKQGEGAQPKPNV